MERRKWLSDMLCQRPTEVLLVKGIAAELEACLVALRVNRDMTDRRGGEVWGGGRDNP